MRKPLLGWFVGMMLLYVGAVWAQAPVSIEEQFEEANRLFEGKKYEEAAQRYESIIASGAESAPIYFNLGNAYFKHGDLGRAVLNYLRARRLDPTNDDINANLAFARQFTSVQMEGAQLNPVSDLLQELINPFQLQTLAWLSSALFILITLLLIVRWGMGYRAGWLKPAMGTTLTLLVIFAFLTTFKYRNDFITRRAVIVSADAPVYTGPSAQSDLELEGAAGLVVTIVGESGNYFNVQFENMRRGWIDKQLVATV